MKILYWVGHVGDKFGAYEKYVLLFARICKEKAHKLIVVHEGPNNIPAYRHTLSELGAEYVSIPHTLERPMQGFSCAINTIKKYRPDIVHFNFTNPLVMPFAKLLGCPLAYRTSHTAIPQITIRTRLSKKMNNLFLDRIFTVSRCVYDYESQAGTRKAKLFLNCLGLPLEDYADRNAAIEKASFLGGWGDPQIRKIITVGRFFPQKGMSFVTQVAIETMHRFPDVIWWMVGRSGPDYEFCQDIVKRNRLEDRILFLGQRNDVPALLKESYLQVVGSLFEGLPLNVLESSIAGVPTIGPNSQGLDEAIENDRTGFLIPTRTVESFVAAISHMLENPELRNRMGENAKHYVVENHDSCHWIEQLINYYELDYSQK